MLAAFFEAFAERRKFFFRYTWPLKLASLRAGRRLAHVFGKADGRKLKSVIAIVPYYGDHRFLAWFLTYYRKLGIKQFVFLDISMEHDLADRLDSALDCAVWRPKGFMHPGKTVDALNYLRHRYARNRWCLSVEPYDLLVFPKSETRHIRDLTDFLESEQRKHAFAIVVDAYGDGPAAELSASGEMPPPEQLPFFDRFGYQTAAAEELDVIPILGGVQRRYLYGDEPQKAPALNRIPLLKVTWDCYYLASTRVVVPTRFNTPHSPWHSTTTTCLLRYALIGSEMSLHIAKQAEPAQLYPDSVTPLFAGSEAMISATLKNQGSQKFTSSRDLLDCGLLNNGQWF
jgi:hypothetical protein